MNGRDVRGRTKFVWSLSVFYTFVDYTVREAVKTDSLNLIDSTLIIEWMFFKNIIFLFYEKPLRYLYNISN